MLQKKYEVPVAPYYVTKDVWSPSRPLLCYKRSMKSQSPLTMLQKKYEVPVAPYYVTKEVWSPSRPLLCYKRCMKSQSPLTMLQKKYEVPVAPYYVTKDVWSPSRPLLCYKRCMKSQSPLTMLLSAIIKDLTYKVGHHDPPLGHWADDGHILCFKVLRDILHGHRHHHLHTAAETGTHTPSTDILPPSPIPPHHSNQDKQKLTAWTSSPAHSSRNRYTHCIHRYPSPFAHPTPPFKSG